MHRPQSTGECIIYIMRFVHLICGEMPFILGMSKIGLDPPSATSTEATGNLSGRQARTRRVLGYLLGIVLSVH
jgi:hypothetical protein